MQPILIAAGAIAEAVAWRLAALGRFRVWRLMPLVLAAMGIGALLGRAPIVAGKASATAALLVGLGSGLALYIGTRVFVAIAGLWPLFRDQVVRAYRNAAEVRLATSLLFSLAIMVPGEELFWRGLVQARLADVVGSGGAAALTWAAYVGANLPSASLPIVAGALVGGALWTALSWWSGGVLASLASHMLWTGMMLVLPPGAGRGVGAA